jgi:hypothetical protein
MQTTPDSQISTSEIEVKSSNEPHTSKVASKSKKSAEAKKSKTASKSKKNLSLNGKSFGSQSTCPENSNRCANNLNGENEIGQNMEFYKQ